jgi:hypothetical protein
MKKLLSIILFTIPLFIFGQTRQEINKILQDMSNEFNRSVPMVIIERLKL